MRKLFLVFTIIPILFMGISFVNADGLAARLLGRILLQVEDNGEAWYIEPVSEERFYLGRPLDAFRIMTSFGLGVSNSDLERFDGTAPSRLSGRILLQVEENGEAFYVNPLDLKMHFLGRPADAFRIMMQFGLGITTDNLSMIIVGFESATLPDIPLLNRFDKKIIYSTDANIDTEPLRNDCKERLGTFNTCGTVCAPDAEACVEVCAFTCELDLTNIDLWTVSTNDELDFLILHPAQMETITREGFVNFSLLGRTQRESTELSDGISFEVSRDRYSILSSLERFARGKLEEQERIGEITEPLSEIIINGVKGLTFTSLTNAEFTHVFLPLGSRRVGIIIYAVPDPENNGYNQVAESMLNSIRFGIPNIAVYEPGINETISKPVTVSGVARVFEGTVNLRIKDSDGNILAEDFTTAMSPDLGFFGQYKTELDYTDPQTTEGTIEVFAISAKDGSEIDKVITPVKF